jgi:sugar phosphate isomerase/epimerase
MNRREFISSSLAAVTGLYGAKLHGAATSSRPIGLQMYTVRDLAEKDLAGVLSAVSKIGYKEVELYWNLYSRPAAELRKMLDDHGLGAPSGHVDYNGFETKLDYVRTLGFQYVVCPMLPEEMWNSVDGYKRAAQQFNIWGEMAKKLGMRFAFHNHNYEFKRFPPQRSKSGIVGDPGFPPQQSKSGTAGDPGSGETTGFEQIVKQTDPQLVWLELDCYWLTQAGLDPVEELKRYARRARMIHIKDRKPGFAPSTVKDAAAEHFTEVGTGTINWKAVIATANKIGVEHFFVEQDSMERPPMESIAISYRNLRRVIG